MSRSTLDRWWTLLWVTGGLIASLLCMYGAQQLRPEGLLRDPEAARSPAQPRERRPGDRSWIQVTTLNPHPTAWEFLDAHRLLHGNTWLLAGCASPIVRLDRAAATGLQPPFWVMTTSLPPGEELPGERVALPRECTLEP